MCQLAKECGASDAVPCHHWAQGGRGSIELAQAVNEAASRPSNFQFLYNKEVRADILVPQKLISYSAYHISRVGWVHVRPGPLLHVTPVLCPLPFLSLSTVTVNEMAKNVV